MKNINIAPLDLWLEKGVGFEIKPINDHTVSVKVTCGEKYQRQEFDFTTFKKDDDETISSVIGTCIEHMTDYVLGIEP